MSHSAAGDKAPQALTGWQLWAAAMFLSMANLIAILDMTIANVSVLGGSLGSVEAVLVSIPEPEPVVTPEVTEPGKQ